MRNISLASLKAGIDRSPEAVGSGKIRGATGSRRFTLDGDYVRPGPSRAAARREYDSGVT